MWFVEVIKAVSWPIVVGAIVYAFYVPLKLLISRIKEGKAFGVEVMIESYKASEFESTVADYMPGGNWPAGVSAPAEIRIELNTLRLGSYYFMGHDLTLCWSAVVTGAPRSMIVHTLTCALDHSGKVGLKGTPFHTALEMVLTDARGSKDDDWTPERRRIEGRKLWTIARRTGDMLLSVAEAAGQVSSIKQP